MRNFFSIITDKLSKITYKNISILTKNIKDDNIIIKLISKFILPILILFVVYLFDEWEGRSIISFGDNRFDISIVSLFLGGFAGTYFVLMVSKYIQHVPVLSYLGRHSIVVLLTHLLYLFLFRNLLFQMGIRQDSISLNLYVFLAIMLLEIPSIKFCVKFLPYCFAQKDLWK